MKLPPAELDQFPQLPTERLILRELTLNDVPTIVAYAGNKDVAKTALNIPHPYEEKDALFWIDMAQRGFEDKTQYIFGISLNETHEFVGGISLRVDSKYDRGELGYWIAKKYWNKGYATEAVGAVLRFGFERVGLHKVYASHYVENPASGKVMLKNGMIKEGELKDHVKKGNLYRSVVQYRLTKGEF